MSSITECIVQPANALCMYNIVYMTNSSDETQAIRSCSTAFWAIILQSQVEFEKLLISSSAFITSIFHLEFSFHLEW